MYRAQNNPWDLFPPLKNNNNNKFQTVGICCLLCGQDTCLSLLLLDTGLTVLEKMLTCTICHGKYERNIQRRSRQILRKFLRASCALVRAWSNLCSSPSLRSPSSTWGRRAKLLPCQTHFS